MQMYEHIFNSDWLQINEVKLTVHYVEHLSVNPEITESDSSKEICQLLFHVSMTWCWFGNQLGEVI